MQLSTLILVFAGLTFAAFQVGRLRSLALVGGRRGMRELQALPSHYGFYACLWCGVPALIFFTGWLIFEPAILTNLLVAALPEEMQSLSPSQLSLVLNDIKNLASGNITSGEPAPAVVEAAERLLHLQRASRAALSAGTITLAIGGIALAWRLISPKLRARIRVERAISFFLVSCSTVAIFTTIGIVLSVLFEAVRFFQTVPVWDFLLGLEWSPQMAIREDQVGSSGAFGAVPLFVGTILISAIAMLVAVPIGLFSAIYLSEYADPRFRAAAKPLLEILAGIPTVVYGFFAALTVAPFIRETGANLGLDVASESALAAGLVMGIMIIPFVSSLSDDSISAVPQSLRDGSYGLGATQSETVRQVVLPAALPGIVGGVLLAVSRAIGETMIVVMAAGLAANLTLNPLESVTTVTVQIVSLLVGDQEFDSAKTLAAFALGLALFLVTLALNIFALSFVRRYREQYE